MLLGGPHRHSTLWQNKRMRPASQEPSHPTLSTTLTSQPGSCAWSSDLATLFYFIPEPHDKAYAGVPCHATGRSKHWEQLALSSDRCRSASVPIPGHLCDLQQHRAGGGGCTRRRQSSLSLSARSPAHLPPAPATQPLWAPHTGSAVPVPGPWSVGQHSRVCSFLSSHLWGKASEPCVAHLPTRILESQPPETGLVHGSPWYPVEAAGEVA